MQQWMHDWEQKYAERLPVESAWWEHLSDAERREWASYRGRHLQYRQSAAAALRGYNRVRQRGTIRASRAR